MTFGFLPGAHFGGVEAAAGTNQQESESKTLLYRQYGYYIVAVITLFIRHVSSRLVSYHMTIIRQNGEAPLSFVQYRHVIYIKSLPMGIFLQC